MSKLNLIERGFDKTLVLIPGWAADSRIFEPLSLSYNYLVPVDFDPFSFEDSLAGYLEKNGISKVSLFGWSMGAFLAVEFAHKYPNLIDALFLVSIRRRYNLSALQEIERKLQKNKKAFLYKFYQDSFAKNELKSYVWFKKHLLRQYLEEIKLEGLIAGLDYLSSVYIKPQVLAEMKKIAIVHGEEDSIAPVKEARIIASYLPQAKFITMKNTGHIPFLSPDFNALIHE